MSTRPIDTSAAGLQALFAAFNSQQLPKAEWTHEAHLLVGLWQVVHAADPLAQMRAGIQRLNAAHGVETTLSGGYHETLTRFYVWALQRYVKEQRQRLGPDAAIAELAPGLLRYAHRELPLLYYSRERLYSPAARFGWVEPDLRGIPDDGSGFSLVGSGISDSDRIHK